MSRRLDSRALLLLSLLTTPSFAADPLQCPEGTTLKSQVNSRKELAEWCMNAAGKRHGPQREFRADGSLLAEGMNDAATGRSVAKIYDEKGALTDDLILQNRKIVEWHFTLAGMEKFVAQLNADWRDLEPKASARVIDQRTVGVDFHFPDADPSHGAAKLESFRSYVRRGFCKLVTGVEQIDSIEIRVLNGRDVDPAMTTGLTRTDCEAQKTE